MPKVICTDIHPRELIPHPNSPVGIRPDILHGQDHQALVMVQKETNYVLAGEEVVHAVERLGWNELGVMLIECDDTMAHQIMLAHAMTLDARTREGRKEHHGTTDSQPAVNTATEKDEENTMKKIVKKFRPFTWVLLAVNLLFLVWVITGVSQASGTPDNCEGLSAEACTVASDAGTAIGVFLIVGLWVAADFILGLIWLITRPTSSSEKAE